MSGFRSRCAQVSAEPDPGAVTSAAGLRGEAACLEEQAARLNRAMRDNAVLDQAVGVLVVAGWFTPQQGRDVLEEVAGRTGIEVRALAVLVVDWGRTGEISARLRDELRASMKQHTAPAAAAS
ncbi:ANTAR domain-containing protein [Streptomyces sp. p1417]|uniref:ANTAR domain-containing protein n=1 Tax=Streptomyces typhae TaxID=2681492 RepID=A0A6L6XCH6_9ACTN|nr:ANTAR domain-containing protein [Streptomyces typhae]MVO90939.1 ANTAR domain-containing protein [Streptomyces typhae]